MSIALTVDCENLVRTLNAKTASDEPILKYEFDEEDDATLFKMFEAYIKEHKSDYPKYRFYYDGSNYGGVDWIFVVRNDQTYKGTCWKTEY